MFKHGSVVKVQLSETVDLREEKEQQRKRRTKRKKKRGEVGEHWNSKLASERQQTKRQNKLLKIICDWD